MSLGAIHTFHYPSPLKQAAPSLIIFTLIAPVVIPIGILVRNPKHEFTSLDLIFTLIAIVAIDGFLYWRATRARLEVSSAGIAYIDTLYTIRSTWDNIPGCGQQSRGVLPAEEALVLRESGLEFSSWIVSNRSRAANLSSMIPVSRFADDWRSSELGVLVKRYAPKAFENLITQ